MALFPQKKTPGTGTCSQVPPIWSLRKKTFETIHNFEIKKGQHSLPLVGLHTQELRKFGWEGVDAPSLPSSEIYIISSCQEITSLKTRIAVAQNNRNQFLLVDSFGESNDSDPQAGGHESCREGRESWERPTARCLSVATQQACRTANRKAHGI